ncbi:integral membrane protein [Aspergillus sclerotiicarbonarius CBS 121057]|uniref:Integral membrane protein n=1 Tax=Aspergillus sclerotiicarbonarius (strain CBS 121057 / IBT 28362) TaxID=1448318 RepID=A0A319FJP5_ASPSB|nr:integral membrane protein [Aspergillus sclerotiicarbonarius CBS 121057]
MDVVWKETFPPDDTVNLKASRVSSIIVCNTVLLIIATSGLLVRLFVRIRYLTGINLDDLLCMISWVFTFVLCFVCIWMTRYGYGKHIETVHSMEARVMFLKLDFVSEIAYLLALGSIKASFCLLYLQIFPGKGFRIACWSLLALLVCETIEETIVVVFQCSPIHKAWDAGDTVKGKCLSLTAFYYISFGIRLATDLALFALPLPKLVRLNMTMGKRAGLVMMFGLGVLVSVTSIIRATYINNFSEDHTWMLVDTLNWSSVEVAVAIFIACIPSFKSLITFRFPALQRLLGLSSKGDSTGRSRMYGTSTRRTNNGRSIMGNHSIKLNTVNTVTGQSRVDVEASRNGSEERIMPTDSGIHVTTDVSVNESD